MQKINKMSIGFWGKIDAFILEDIRVHADKVLNDSEGFYAKLARKLEKQHTADEGTLKKELATLTARVQEIDKLFMSLYEDSICQG